MRKPRLFRGNIVNATLLSMAGQQIGDLLYADSTLSFTRLADVATGSVLISGGVGAPPSWSSSPTIPKIIGGTAVGSSLDLQATSAVGTTDYVRVLVGNNGATESTRFYHSGVVGIGTGSTIPGATLHIDATGGSSLRLSRNSSSTTAYLQFDADATNAYISTGDANTPLLFRVNNTEKWRIATTGALITGTDNAVDIGAPGATRPRTGYFGTSVIIAGNTAATLADNLGSFASTTSAQLAGVISDETGSGALVFATSPTLVTPTIGVASGTSLTLSGKLVSQSTGFTAVNGNNNDISIGTTSFIRITGPTAAFTITGIAGGVDGQILTIVNSTTQNMTIADQNANSLAANRIIVLNGADFVTTGIGGAVLIYSGTDSRWILISREV